MELTYDLTQKDFYNSFLTHRERSLGLKWCFRMLIGFTFLLPAIGILNLAMNQDTKVVSVIPLFALAAFWALFIWGVPWWSARTQFLQQPAAQGSRNMTLDGSGIHWRWKGGQADVDWTNFIRYLESNNLFLLYTSPVCFNIVPKRAFRTGEAESFRGLLQEKLGATTAARRKGISPDRIVFLVVVAVAVILLVQVIRVITKAH